MAHVIITWIFLLKFFIAMMIRTFYTMQQQGDFLYKKTKYQYIEKYSIPMLNHHGYDELVNTPAPLNVFTMLMIPFSMSKTMTTHMAFFYTRLVYWTENIFYMLVFFFYELFLVPIIFIRVSFNALRLAGIFSMLPLLLVWFLISPIVLVMGVCKDNINFIKILCYNHQEDSKMKRENEFRQDKIWLFNELIDVVKSI